MDLEALFPRLAGTPYRRTGPADTRYNCFAWAAGETHRWWEAHPDAGEYWPTGLTEDWTIDVVVAAYAALGYVPCADGNPEAGVDKVAIYVRDGQPTHAARLLPSGLWTSKLGAQDDIEHVLVGL
jgi:hypothetical protein